MGGETEVSVEIGGVVRCLCAVDQPHHQGDQECDEKPDPRSAGEPSLDKERWDVHQDKQERKKNLFYTLPRTSIKYAGVVEVF